MFLVLHRWLEFMGRRTIVYEGPGEYVHYKGGHYEVIGLAVREESKEDGWITEVIYKPLTPGSMLEDRPETMWSRKLGDFDQVFIGMDWGNGGYGSTTVLHRFSKIDHTAQLKAIAKAQARKPFAPDGAGDEWCTDVGDNITNQRRYPG